MKKNWRKRAAALCLALAVIMGLTACGGEKNENATLAKEGVYKFQEITLPKIEADYYYITSTAHRNGKVYLVIQAENWRTGDGETVYHLISMNEDGSDINSVILETPQQDNAGAVSEPGGIAPQPRVETNMPGEDTDTEGTEPDENADPDETEPGEDTEGTEPDEEADPDAGSEIDPGFEIDEPADYEGEDFWEYSNYYNFVVGPDGGVYGLKMYQYESYGEEYYSVQKYYSCKWDSQGKYLSETELQVKDPDKEEWININAMSIASGGTVYLVLTGDSAYMMEVDSQGNASQRKELPEDVRQIFTNYNNIIVKEDGSFISIYSDEDDWTKQYLVDFDPVSGTMGEPASLPSTFTSKGFNSLMAGVDADLVFTDNNGVYSYNVGAADVTLKMSFVNSDLDISYLNNMIELDSNTFIGAFNAEYKDDICLGLFTYVKPEDIPDKSVLVMAGNYVPWDMKSRVVEFNRNSDQYRIVIKEYNTYNTYDDWNAGVTQLNNDITTGKMPDILIASSELPMENYAAKGLLEDIGKLIEADEELSQVEFVQNVFDACSFDGNLYYVIPSFSVQTMIGKTSVVGDRTGWTMEEAQQLLATLPEGTRLFGEMTRDSYFSTALGYCAGDFVDVTTGKCDFDSDRFIKLMEYAKGLPENMDEDYFGEDYYMNYQSQYRENRTILMQLYISSVRDLNYSINGRFGEDVSYVGFPMEGGQGACVNANSKYAISSKCNFTEGAWEFLRYYLTDEYQNTLSWNLPVNKKIFLENAQLALERPYWEDPDTGEKEYYDETFYINGESIVLPPMTQAQVDKVVNYIFSLQKSSYYNTNVMNIINEEMGGYFSGQKSAQEVAAVIQNRVQLYVDENR